MWRALAKEPEDRFPSCGAFIAALRGDANKGRSVPTNGTAPGADKSHKSGELHSQDESDADARPPDRPKSDS